LIIVNKKEEIKILPCNTVWREKYDFLFCG